MTETDTERLAAAYELGCSRGWDHANFVDAYGPEHDKHKRDVAPPYEEIHDRNPLYWELTPAERGAANELRRKQRGEFLRGWTDGRKRFRQNRYPDGSKIED